MSIFTRAINVECQATHKQTWDIYSHSAQAATSVAAYSSTRVALAPASGEAIVAAAASRSSRTLTRESWACSRCAGSNVNHIAMAHRWPDWTACTP